MSPEKEIIYADESEATEKSVDPNEVTKNLRDNGVVLGHSDSELERITLGTNEDSLNFDDVSKGLEKSGFVIETDRDPIDNLDNDPHLAAFLETRDAA